MHHQETPKVAAFALGRNRTDGEFPLGSIRLAFMRRSAEVAFPFAGPFDRQAVPYFAWANHGPGEMAGGCRRDVNGPS